ncbi:hypothetical protein D3C87_2100250 [compost metagenome]
MIPISRVPQRATELVTAVNVPATNPPFTLEQLVSAPIGRVDAFGVGFDPEAEPVENESGR